MISMLETQLVSFDQSNNPGSVDLKMDGSVLKGKTSFKMLRFSFSSILYWDSYIVSIAITAPEKIGGLIGSIISLSPEVSLYLYKSTIWPSMEYCCHIWASTPSCCYLDMLDKLQKQVCKTVSHSVAASVKP